MEPDSGLDFVVDDSPGIGRSADDDQASLVERSDQHARQLLRALQEVGTTRRVQDHAARIAQQHDASSPGADKSIAELEIRRTTG